MILMRLSEKHMNVAAVTEAQDVDKGSKLSLGLSTPVEGLCSILNHSLHGTEVIQACLKKINRGVWRSIDGDR